MATTYSFQKGKYGGQCGFIFPYFSELNTNNNIDEKYLNDIPAGFLRCRGQILSADQYPELASLIGVGDECIYKKSTTILQNRNADGTGGTLQLPDLGSKYISAGSSPGSYDNMFVEGVTTTTPIYRAGVEVSLDSVGNEITFTYSGNFTIPQHQVNLSGQWTVRSPSSTGRTVVNEGQVLTHGHYATFAQLQNGVSGQCGGRWRWRTVIYYCRQRGIVANSPGFIRLQPIGIAADEAGSESGTNHSHNNANFVITNQTKRGIMDQTSFPASSIQTTVRLNTSSTTKIDSIAPKFILCEYLIKH
jgi:hypothetical protein